MEASSAAYTKLLAKIQVRWLSREHRAAFVYRGPCLDAAKA